MKQKTKPQGEQITQIHHFYCNFNNFICYFGLFCCVQLLFGLFIGHRYYYFIVSVFSSSCFIEINFDLCCECDVYTRQMVTIIIVLQNKKTKRALKTPYGGNSFSSFSGLVAGCAMKATPRPKERQNRNC